MFSFAVVSFSLLSNIYYYMSLLEMTIWHDIEIDGTQISSSDIQPLVILFYLYTCIHS